MVTNRTLAKIATYGAVVTITTGVYVNWKVQDGLKSSQYFKDSLKLLRTHQGAVELLGEPMKSGNLNLGDPEHNHCDGFKAQFEVPVKGPKNSGTLFLWAKRETPQQQWIVSRLELELKNDPSRRLIIRGDSNINE
ncbi:cytochrome c oxidase assembly factor 1 homolog [Anabrus simplex]|uniref:cytochrome c oxidase assembly factor 1 homolog n=1 Tax=Anabrus simplex TaxID=316456 RepID=UPI0034DCECFD